jgi:hypothetical protein
MKEIYSHFDCWEELSYRYSGIDAIQELEKIVAEYIDNDIRKNTDPIEFESINEALLLML